MSAASLATACPNELTARRRLRRRRASVPARIEPGQSIRVNVHMPKNKARRVPAACSFYKLEASLLNLDTNEVKFIKLDEGLIAGGGWTIEFVLDNNGETPAIITDAATVSARVEVTPTDSGACATIKPVVSFVLKDNDGRHTFLPSQELDPVHLRPVALGGPIIIIDK